MRRRVFLSWIILPWLLAWIRWRNFRREYCPVILACKLLHDFTGGRGVNLQQQSSAAGQWQGIYGRVIYAQHRRERIRFTGEESAAATGPRAGNQARRQAGTTCPSGIDTTFPHCSGLVLRLRNLKHQYWIPITCLWESSLDALERSPVLNL
jgi:hypothetical protein